MPRMLVKHKDGTGLHQLIYADGFICIAASRRTYTRDLLVEVFLDGRGRPESLTPFPVFPLISRHFAGDIFEKPFQEFSHGEERLLHSGSS